MGSSGTGGGEALVWFRTDLRLEDNPAWQEATSAHERVTALYVFDDERISGLGEHRRQRLLGELHQLDAELTRRGGRLRVVPGPVAEAVVAEAARFGVRAIHVNEVIDPLGRADLEAVRLMTEVPVVSGFGSLITEPGSVLTAAGHVPRTFAAFHTAWLRTAARDRPAGGEGRPTDRPHLVIPQSDVTNGSGTAAGLRAIDAFLDRLADYDKARDDIPADATSHLSEFLAFGSLSPAQVLDRVIGEPSSEGFVRQLAWRDWYAHHLWFEPRGFTESMLPMYDRMRWDDTDEVFDRWVAGRTGYPLVDAGMRQLARSGRMHNRVRMVAASFLVKHLLVDWRRGEAYFRRELVDYDPSQNVGNWQWVAGSGFDAAPWFRIFNPVRQSQRFDPRGEYIRSWVPELAHLDIRSIHEPWAAAGRLDEAADYPRPMVDHATARQRALLENKRLRQLMPTSPSHRESGHLQGATP